MENPSFGTVSLLGLGVSNKAVLSYLSSKNIPVVVRNYEKIDLPKGTFGIFGKDYLNTCEDTVFRSPSVRPDKILGRGKVYTEISYSLEALGCYKIGITGSDGKTTTATLCHKILEAGGKGSYLVGNVGTPLITYLDSVKKEDTMVCELSSFQLFDFVPSLDIAVVTGITPNHLDWHTDLYEYVLSKRNITKNARRVILPIDLPSRWLFEGENVSYFSLGDLSALSGKHAYLKDGYVYYGKKRLFPKEKIKLLGDFNIKNVLCAVAATYDLVGIEPILRALSTFGGVKHRMETVAEINGVSFVDSSIDSTPDRTKCTLSAFDRSRVIAIMGGYDKNLKYDSLKDATNGLYALVVMGENRDKILAKQNASRVFTVNTMDEAVKLAFSLARVGDTVLLSPASASFDMYKNYEEKSQAFICAIRGIENGRNKENS
ncbi:MAG: UDP-N-acetylmuramoyl-L-alanine--D-glutamate ligase [Clostridia bacterium]|nr:UDP-N-acetylmuramoyl-L-alanine--D-glutamate ligase [Clostridia bacterium]